MIFSKIGDAVLSFVDLLVFVLCIIGAVVFELVTFALIAFGLVGGYFLAVEAVRILPQLF